MRPFLVVGCGGSGGVTLQFLMDQLAGDLAQRRVGSLPAAWQFVHIDVPISPDGTGPGLPPPVDKQGGRYVALGPQAASYQAIAANVTEQLIAAKCYGQLATWLAHPQRTPVDIAEGAGQMRAVGRVVTLSRLGKAREGLTAALEALNASGVREELGQLALRLGGDPTQSTAKPIVLVVSSMAGGAGSSMVLDICRVLSQLDAIAPESTGLFLYTPEIFDSIEEHKRSGVPGNALAMMGELLATQLGAATRDDAELFAALQMGTARAGRGIPFGRVFPIGAKIGENGAKFGGGRLEDIYRGVGRGLAALMLSGEATRSWSAYDLGNNTPLGGTTEAFGWTATSKDVQWGSFGFAQLSLGRDRYAEYAAQRLAHSCVQRLLAGHRSPKSSQTDPEQLERRAHDRAPEFYGQLQLPLTVPLGRWFEQTFDGDAGDLGLTLVQTHVERALSSQTGNAQQWVGYVVNEVSRGSAVHNGDATAGAYRIVHAWYEGMRRRAQAEVAASVARDGIPTTARLLTRLQADVDSWSAEIREAARQLRADATDLPPDVLARANALKGNIDARHQIITEFRQGYLGSSRNAVKGQVAALLGEVFVSCKNDLLQPLRTALGEASAGLQQAVSSSRRGAGLAQLRTEEFAEWPVAGEPVPPRFTQAHNEVLLVNAADFPDRYDEHVIGAMTTTGRADLSATDATGLAVREIVADAWETRAAPRRGGLLVEQARWRPAGLSRLPGTTENAPTGPAVYRLAVLTGELLERARSWTSRPDGPFEAYTSTTLREYVAGEDLPDYERERRAQEVASKFRNTLELAKPLVTVDQTLARALHGIEVEVAYKFGEIPFAGLALEADLRRDVEQAGSDTTSAKDFASALRPDSRAARIDVFGSYPPLSPLVISSLLRPLAAGWATASLSRASFHALRRARRLPGALAMSDQQRRAVIGGWYVARFTGRLRLPGEALALDSVQVYDGTERRDWVSFPHPLAVDDLVLTLSADNFLPAVMLSFGLAMAQASAESSLGPLHPYTVLRRFWDDSSGFSAHDPIGLLAANRQIGTWLAERVWPVGAPPNRVTPSLGTPEQDRAALLATIEGIRTVLGSEYLRPGEEPGAPGGGRWSVVAQPQDIWEVPLFHEIARDVFSVLGELSTIVRTVVIPTPGAAGPISGVELGG